MHNAATTPAPTALRFAVVIDGHTARDFTWVVDRFATRAEAVEACDAENLTLELLGRDDRVHVEDTAIDPAPAPRPLIGGFEVAYAYRFDGDTADRYGVVTMAVDTPEEAVAQATADLGLLAHMRVVGVRPARCDLWAY